MDMGDFLEWKVYKLEEDYVKQVSQLHDNP